MPEMENIVLSVIFFLIMCVVFFFIKLKKKKSGSSTQQKFILETLNLAKTQFEIFNIRSDASGETKNGVSALLENIAKDSLHLESSDFVPAEWVGSQADVFFRARNEDGPVFYTFRSVVKKINSDYEQSKLEIALPNHLRVEKKRHFLRVQPFKNDVQVIGVWPIRPGSHLPHSSSEIGKPITQYRKGRTGEPVQVENVSASGMALRFKLDKNGNPPAEFRQGSQLICLIVYKMDESETKPTAFWCTGEIMNSRIAEGKERDLVLGLEYTNWAILEQGTSDIHWAHSSPTKGAKPILRWVEKIDQRNALNERKD